MSKSVKLQLKNGKIVDQNGTSYPEGPYKGTLNDEETTSMLHVVEESGKPSYIVVIDSMGHRMILSLPCENIKKEEDRWSEWVVNVSPWVAPIK